MGVVADAVIGADGHAIGVIPHALVAREIAHRGLPDLRVVNSMHERKVGSLCDPTSRCWLGGPHCGPPRWLELADAFVALPGGFGTVEEFCEAVTWTQLGLHRKRCGLLNVGGFYDPLLALFDRASEDGFVKRDNRDIVIADADPATLLDRLAAPLEMPGKIWLLSPEQA